MIRATFTTRRTRALCFDLESRPLAFWWGDKTTAQITAFGWKWDDEPEPRTMLLRADGKFQPEDSRPIPAKKAYERFAAVLAEADLVYGHNVLRFDLPLLNAGMLRLVLPPLPELRVTDTLRHLPKRADMSASLASLAAMYRLDENGKLSLSTIEWERANQLSPDGMALARKRVASDVVLQEQLRERLLELGLLRPPVRWRPM